MRRLLFIISITSVMLSCKTSKLIIEKNNAAYLDGTWQLQMLFASDNTWEKAPLININFKEKEFSGYSGCNNIRGKFILIDDYFAFDKNIISTKMACLNSKSNQQEITFLSAMQKINKYTLDKNELELGQGEIVLMKFIKSQIRQP